MSEERRVLVVAVETGRNAGGGVSMVQIPADGNRDGLLEIAATGAVFDYIDLPALTAKAKAAGFDDIESAVEAGCQTMQAAAERDRCKGRLQRIREALDLGPDDDVVEAVGRLRAIENAHDGARQEAEAGKDEIARLRAECERLREERDA